MKEIHKWPKILLGTEISFTKLGKPSLRRYISNNLKEKEPALRSVLEKNIPGMASYSMCRRIFWSRTEFGIFKKQIEIYNSCNILGRAVPVSHSHTHTYIHTPISLKHTACKIIMSWIQSYRNYQ